MPFEFATAHRIIFGRGTLTQVGPSARELGHRALVTIGLDPSHGEPLFRALTATSLSYVTLQVTGEPSVALAAPARSSRNRRAATWSSAWAVAAPSTPARRSLRWRPTAAIRSTTWRW